MKPKPQRKYPLTRKRILRAVEDSMAGIGNPGFCLACGADAEGVEPDAREYVCEECGEARVFGAEECMMSLIMLR